MFDLGTQELIVIFIVAFLVFGPKKLPELGRTLGKGIRELKEAMRGVRASIEEAGDDVMEEMQEAKTGLEDAVKRSMGSGEDTQGDTKEKPGDSPAKDDAADDRGESSGRDESDRHG